MRGCYALVRPIANVLCYFHEKKGELFGARIDIFIFFLSSFLFLFKLFA